MPNSRQLEEFANRLFLAQSAWEAKALRRLERAELGEMVGKELKGSISPATVSQWFQANQMPSIVQAGAIAKVLGVSPGWLAYGEGVMLSGNHDPAKPFPVETRTKLPLPQAKRRRKG